MEGREEEGEFLKKKAKDYKSKIKNEREKEKRREEEGKYLKKAKLTQNLKEITIKGKKDRLKGQ